MRQMNNIRLLGGSLLLLLTALSSCSEYEEGRPDMTNSVPLTFHLQASGHQYATRGYEGDVTAITGENIIYDAKVWAYDATSKLFIGYGETTADDAGNTLDVTLEIPRYIVTSGRNVDIYAIGNTKSVGLSELDAASGANIDLLTSNVLGGTNFTPAGTTTITGDGLPMSCIEQDFSIVVEGEISTTLPTIMMTRAVSKVRFAFGRTTGYDDVAITGIEIDGGLIPNSERIFPLDKATSAENYATVSSGTYHGDRYPNIITADDYIADKKVYRATGDEDFTTTLIPSLRIQEYANPVQNIWPATVVNGGTAMTAQEYSEYVTEIINNQYNFTTYLRESDQKISGTIHYVVGGVKKQTAFTMDAAGDFARNHEWIVYGYFDPAQLSLTVTVQPWELIEKEMDYDDNITVTTGMAWSNYNVLQSDYDNKSLVFNSTGDDRTIVCTFELGTPKGFNWTASFNTLAGSPTAFKFLDADGNQVNTISGEIGTGASTLKIVCSDLNPSIDSEAELLIVVPIEGRYRPVDSFECWHLTQRKVN